MTIAEFHKLTVMQQLDIIQRRMERIEKTEDSGSKKEQEKDLQLYLTAFKDQPQVKELAKLVQQGQEIKKIKELKQLKIF